MKNIPKTILTYICVTAEGSYVKVNQLLFLECPSDWLYTFNLAVYPMNKGTSRVFI